MKHRALVRVVLTASMVTVAGFMVAGPAAAADSPPPTPIGVLDLPLPEDGIAVDGVDARACTKIPGDAKAGTDGWVFSQPVKDPTEVAYIIGLVATPTTEPEPVLVAITKDGITGLKIDDSLQAKAKAGVKGLTQDTGDAAKELAATAADDTDPAATDILDGVERIAAPAGVAGGLLADDGGAWLQTPAGWILAFGALLHDGGDTDASTFDLAGVCPPAADPPAGGNGGGGTVPVVNPPASGGDSLPITGTNVSVLVGLGILLLGLGTALVVVRRRRATFIA
jgi:LPXTG-motif cell wall-anchored protein